MQVIKQASMDSFGATISVRFTMRRMMLVIAIVGVVASLEAARRRHDVFQSRLSYHAGELQGIADENLPWTAVNWESVWYPNRESPVYRPGPSEIRAYEKNRELRIAYHEAMYGKYKRAVARPWVPVETDLPAPPPYPDIDRFRHSSPE